MLSSCSERWTFLAALAASLLSTCILFQAVDDIVDDHLIDLRTFGMLLIAGAAFAIAWFCMYELKRGRTLRAVRWCFREHLRALPALRSPATLFLMTFAAILTIALIAHLGEAGVATALARWDIVVSLLTATILAAAAALGAQVIMRVAPEVVRFIMTLLTRLTGSTPLVVAVGTKATAPHWFAAWSPPLFGRPPPLSL